jgi:hypothetical protein
MSFSRDNGVIAAAGASGVCHENDSIAENDNDRTYHAIQITVVICRAHNARESFMGKHRCGQQGVGPAGADENSN